MQLTLHAEYALRVLLYLGVHPDRSCTTREISETYRISRNHLVRVVQTLSEHGYVELQPGRCGGIRLKQEPRLIRLGNVVRDAEPNMRMAECFNRSTNTCVLTPVCSLRPALNEALEAFLSSLNRYSLADLFAHGSQRQMAARFATIALTS